MQEYQRAFIAFALKNDVLRFGEITLKSGRVSPYFFNAGLFSSGQALAELGRFYAEAICDAGVVYEMLFGPAYKGIPLVSATAIALAEQHGLDIPYAFNRKETKDHGEGGSIVGAEMQGKALIVDDVITAGTAIREVMSLFETHRVSPAGVVVALDRQERGKGLLSAIQEVERDYLIPVISIITLSDLIEYLRENGNEQTWLARVEAYRSKYGTD